MTAATMEAEEVEVAPEIAGFRPKPFQLDAHNAVWMDFDRGVPSTLVCKPTGVGKTILFGMVAKTAIETRGGWVLVLAHRDELLEQAQAKLAFVGVDSVIEKAAQKARQSIAEAKDDLYHPRDIRCVVASVQSMRGDRLASWPRDAFSLIITDEAHHATADSYGAIYRHFLLAKHLGVTATPGRTDGTNLGSVFESVAYEYLLPQAIADGNLAPITVCQTGVRIDLRAVNADARDFNQGDLEDAISPHVEQMVRAIKENAGSRRGILFAPGRKSVDQAFRPCQAFAEGLRKVGISAQAVWGDHPDRLPLLRSFAEGEFQVICNADLLCEGYDAPFVEFIAGCRPTQSAALAAQMLGRGTRLSPATGKSDCLFIDFDFLMDKYRKQIIKPYDLVCPAAPDDARRIAAEIVASGEETDVLKVAELAESRAAEERARREEEERIRAEAEAKRLAEREAAKANAMEIAAKRAEADEARRNRLERESINLRVRDGESGLSFRRFDPFASALGLAGLATTARKDAGPFVKASRRQVDALATFGVDPMEAGSYSESEAAAMRSWCFRRYVDNMATIPQLNTLKSLGVAHERALQFSKRDASDYIDRCGGGRARRSG